MSHAVRGAITETGEAGERRQRIQGELALLGCAARIGEPVGDPAD